ncbi:MAG: alkaline shock response membrane anchor protein AmaP [Chloroflexi bacterium]|nr:alkaline shock response membrane anchor protein AmaP [Chloroflexota bacterium]
MNIFNRVVMIILIIALAALSIFFLVRPMDTLNYAAATVKVLQDQIYDNRFFTYLVIGGAIFLFVLLLLFVLEVRRAHFRIARVHTQGKSDTWLGIQSIAKTLEFHIDELPEVRSVKPKVVSRGKDIEVFVDLDVSPKANIVTLTEQVAQICSNIVETQLGLKIHNKVTIHVSQEPYPRVPSAAEVKGQPVTTPPSSSTPASESKEG